MKIEVEILGWTNICCGCKKKINSTDKTYMISKLIGINCSIHLCDSCIDEIIKSKESHKEA